MRSREHSIGVAPLICVLLLLSLMLSLLVVGAASLGFEMDLRVWLGVVAVGVLSREVRDRGPDIRPSTRNNMKYCSPLVVLYLKAIFMVHIRKNQTSYHISSQQEYG